MGESIETYPNIHNTKGLTDMAPRQAENTSSVEKVVKPSLPFKVTGTLPNGTDFDFPCSRSTAMKSAKEYMKQGFQRVTIWEHNGNAWDENTAMTEQVRTSLQGTGNQRGVMALQQLIERSNVLVKMTGKAQKNELAKRAYDSEVRDWLQQFGFTCQALHVTPSAINETLGAIFAQPVEA